MASVGVATTASANWRPNANTRWVWRPQHGPQDDLVQCPYTEVFFGGARGGGKTDGVLGKWALKERRYGKHFNACHVSSNGKSLRGCY